MSEPAVNRRRVLLGGAVAGAGLTAAAAATTQAPAPGVGTQTPISGGLPWSAGAADGTPEAVGTSYVFFTAAEAAFVEAAVARLIPGDKGDPGAIEAGVPFFIDRQLAGPFGRADHFFMQGPWPEALPTQGYQSRLTPAKMYRAAIPAIDDLARHRGSGHIFHEMSAADQDGFLKDMEAGKLQLAGVQSKAFFALLLQNAKEGFFSDPIYGGNRDLVGWRMIGFPGAHYDYRDWVKRHGERVPFPSVGIKGRPGWTEDA